MKSEKYPMQVHSYNHDDVCRHRVVAEILNVKVRISDGTGPPTVAVNKKFTFRLHSTVVLRCERLRSMLRAMLRNRNGPELRTIKLKRYGA